MRMFVITEILHNALLLARRKQQVTELCFRTWALVKSAWAVRTEEPWEDVRYNVNRLFRVVQLLVFFAK